MLAYYIEWHMRQALAPLLFDDEDPAAAQAERSSIVAPARRSAGALRKAATRRTTDNLPVHNFQTLLADLATLTKNRVRFLAGSKSLDGPTAELLTQPTPLQQRAFDLLQLSPM